VEERLVEVASDVLIDGRIVRETLCAAALAGGKYRLLKSPLVAQGLAVGDEFEVDPICGSFRVVRRGGNVTVQLFMPELTQDVFEQLAVAVRYLGGDLDGHTDSIAGFWVPVSAGFPSIERLFIGFVDGRPDTEWMFGNVYGLDGVPLNWW
jgi:hypothetical protein